MPDRRDKTGGSTRGATRLDPDGVFVVRFRAADPQGNPSGRVECVSSGQRASFESPEELLAFMLSRVTGGPERGS